MTKLSRRLHYRTFDKEVIRHVEVEEIGQFGVKRQFTREKGAVDLTGPFRSDSSFPHEISDSLVYMKMQRIIPHLISRRSQKNS